MNASIPFQLYDDERLDEINENLRLIQKKDGLTFGTDAYLLSAFARPFPGKLCVDLGSGTGVAALLCQSRCKYRHVTAVEIQNAFCDLIKRNASLNGMTDSVDVLNRDVRSITAKDLTEHPAVVISNPPYMAADSGFSSADTRMDIARRELNGTIYDFCRTASDLLQSGGLFYTVYRPDRMVDLLTALRQTKLEPKRIITVYPDTDSRPCLILVESRKDGAPQLLQSRPLIIYKSQKERVYTDAMARVYDTFSLEFLFANKTEKHI